MLRLCADAGMVKVGVVALDGTKIAANASRSANRSPEWVRERANKIAEEVVGDAAAVDAAEDAAAATRGGGSDEDLPPGFTRGKDRSANIAKALAELDRQDAEHAEADAADRAHGEEFLQRIEAGEAPTGRIPSGIDLVRYHRARVHREEQRIAQVEGVRGREASNQRREARKTLRRAQEALARAEAHQAAGTADRRGRAALKRDRKAAAAQARGGPGRVVNLTDPNSRLMTEGSGGGSVQGYNAQIAVTDDHLILGVHVSQDANDTGCYQPTLAQATTQAAALGKTIELVLADAGYFTEDNLTTPGPDRLIAPGKNKDITARAHQTLTQDLPPQDADPREIMRHRLRQPENADRYKRRSATVETVIAHLKETTRLRRFTRRGLHAATAELNLAAAAINLTRLHHATPATG